MNAMNKIVIVLLLCLCGSIQLNAVPPLEILELQIANSDVIVTSKDLYIEKSILHRPGGGSPITLCTVSFTCGWSFRGDLEPGESYTFQYYYNPEVSASAVEFDEKLSNKNQQYLLLLKKLNSDLFPTSTTSFLPIQNEKLKVIKISDSSKPEIAEIDLGLVTDLAKNPRSDRLTLP